MDEGTSNVEVLQLVAQPTLIVRASVLVADLPEAVGDRTAVLSDFLRSRGIRPTGPPFVRYHTFGETETDFELGVPIAEPVVGEGRVAGGELPAGLVATTWHVGPHDRLGEAYRRIGAWLRGHGRVARSPAWEVYPWLDIGGSQEPSSAPDPAGWRTQLVQPIESS